MPPAVNSCQTIAVMLIDNSGSAANPVQPVAVLLAIEGNVSHGKFTLAPGCPGGTESIELTMTSSTATVYFKPTVFGPTPITADGGAGKFPWEVMDAGAFAAIMVRPQGLMTPVDPSCGTPDGGLIELIAVDPAQADPGVPVYASTPVNLQLSFTGGGQTMYKYATQQNSCTNAGTEIIPQVGYNLLVTVNATFGNASSARFEALLDTPYLKTLNGSNLAFADVATNCPPPGATCGGLMCCAGGGSCPPSGACCLANGSPCTQSTSCCSGMCTGGFTCSP
jgi:hypothetical protein